MRLISRLEGTEGTPEGSRGLLNVLEITKLLGFIEVEGIDGVPPPTDAVLDAGLCSKQDELELGILFVLATVLFITEMEAFLDERTIFVLTGEMTLPT